MTPMIASDYVKVLPISYFFEPPEQMPIRYSETQYSDIMPKKYLEFFHANVNVESMQLVENGFRTEGKLYPCRSIFVHFPKDELLYHFFYNLYQMEVIDYDDKTRKMKFHQTLPKEPPTENEFYNWVYQSINQSAGSIYDEVLFENVMAANYDASYLTDSKFISDLLSIEDNKSENIQEHTTNLLLKFDLPFFNNADINTLMKVRKENGEAFQSFRIELDKKLRELRLENDPEKLKIKLENAFHEIVEVQVNEINKTIQQIKKSSKLDLFLLVGGLAGSIQTGGASLLASAIAIAKGYKNYTEYHSKIQMNPSFFYWKVKK